MPYSFLRDRSINDVFFRYVANFTYDWESWHDPQGKVVWVNDAVERMTGYSAAECLKMPDYPLEIVSAADRPKIAQMLASAIAQGTQHDLEFEITTRDGRQRWMAVSWQPMFDDQQTHLGFRTSIRDVTDRWSLKEQLREYTEHLEQLVQERSSRIAQLEQHRQQMEKLAALGELAAGVAHEVNNPLAGIRNAFSLLQSSLSPESEHYELLELIDSEIERIRSIIHQMYQLYRRTPPQAHPFEITKTIRGVRYLLEPIARRYSVRLEVGGEDSWGVVCLPEGEVKQILFNIIRNAIQASSPESVVAIELTAHRTVLTVAVIDQGHGISADQLPHIFEPFYTTKSQLKEGMGLGLSVSRSLAESMGGTIAVESRVGIGSRFTITLPRRG